MAVSPEVHIPASELSQSELKRLARGALAKRQEGLELEHREDRARENLATVENILRIPEVDAYLSRSNRVDILKVTFKNPSGIKHRHFLFSRGTELFLEMDYFKRREDGWIISSMPQITSYDDLHHSDAVVKALSELSAADIIKKFQRAFSRRPF